MLVQAKADPGFPIWAWASPPRGSGGPAPTLQKWGAAPPPLWPYTLSNMSNVSGRRGFEGFTTASPPPTLASVPHSKVCGDTLAGGVPLGPGGGAVWALKVRSIRGTPNRLAEAPLLASCGKDGKRRFKGRLGRFQGAPEDRLGNLPLAPPP